MERTDLEAELLRQVDHRRHLVGAVAVVVDEDFAVEGTPPASPSAGCDRDASSDPPLRRATFSTCRDNRPPTATCGGTPRRCPCGSTASGCAARIRASDSRRRPSSIRPAPQGTSSPRSCGTARSSPSRHGRRTGFPTRAGSASSSRRQRATTRTADPAARLSAPPILRR